jgi:hypothetical protein
MVPSKMIFIESLPLSPSGKIQRGQLAMLPVAESAHSEFVAPRSPDEITLAAIWEEVLGIRPIGVRDGFIRSGGNSLLSMQIVARANRAGLRLSVRDMLLNDNIEDLCKSVRELQWEKEA